MVRISSIPVFLLLILASTSARAQEPPEGAEPTAIPKLVKGSAEALEEMRGAQETAFAELEAARAAQDLKRLGCVSESLSAIKGLVRLGEQSYVMLREAAAQRDRKTVQHESVKLDFAARKVLELSAQLKACAGPGVVGEADGESQLRVESDPELKDLSPRNDPLSWFLLDELIVRVPDTGSPFF